jgi:hypothetical protein
MSRVLGVLPWARYTPHLETDLELFEEHLERGDEVDVLCCRADLPACDRNPRHLLGRCRMCVGRLDAALRLLSRPVRRFPIVDPSAKDSRELAALRREFATEEELKAFRVDGFDLGYGVLSSMISFLRDPDPVSAANRPWLSNLLVSALAVHRSVRHRLAAEHYDRVYVYNGRFAITRAVLRACTSAGVECFTHERGSDHSRYSLHHNTTIHDPGAMYRAIHEAWEAERDNKRRQAIGAKFYEERAGGREQAWISYVKDQRVDLLPKGFDPEGRNIVIFNSSEDEFAAIGDAWRNPLYETQNDGIVHLAGALADHPEIRLWLRVHPNLRGVENRQTREIEAFSFPNLTKIAADSPVGSYALLRSAWKVATFGSTMGIEATFWRRPSVLLGPSLYRELGATFNPVTLEEAIDLLVRDLEPKPLEPALRYGFYQKTFGRPFRHYRPQGVFRGTFRGKRVRPPITAVVAAAVMRSIPPFEECLSARARKRRLDRLLGSTRGTARG